MHKFSIVGASVLALLTVSVISVNAAIESEVGALVGGERARRAIDDINADLKRYLTGDAPCYYAAGWNGPGCYRRGFAWRRGYGSSGQHLSVGRHIGSSARSLAGGRRLASRTGHR